MSEQFSIERARRLRAKRVAVLRKLREGPLSLREALLDPPDALLGVHIYTVLLAAPQVGESTARKVLEEANVWPHTKMSDVPKLKRRLVVASLPERVE